MYTAGQDGKWVPGRHMWSAPPQTHPLPNTAPLPCPIHTLLIRKVKVGPPGRRISFYRKKELVKSGGIQLGGAGSGNLCSISSERLL